MKLRRLLKMSPAEIVVRSKQGLARKLSRITDKSVDAQTSALYDNLSSDPICLQVKALHSKGESERAAEKLLQHFKAKLPGRFFSGACEQDTAQLLRSYHPIHCSKTIAAADGVCAGMFEILGYGRISYGAPVDWHRDPIAGRRTELVHWTRIDLEHETVGDIKVVWELNRHQWLLDLGQAYLLTADEKYANCFVALVQEWMEQNPPELGINWTSSLEVAMRMISWCWALALFRDSDALSAAFYVRMLNWIRLHGDYVQRYLSTYFSPNTHLTGETLGLFYVGTLFPELAVAEPWVDESANTLVAQLSQQVYSDGVYFEQSACYQYYTTEFYQHFLILAQINRKSLPPVVIERLHRMLDFQLAMRQPNGLMPQFGDSDGGWLAPLSRRLPGDDRGLFATAAVLLQRSDLRWAAAQETIESLWLLGASGHEAFLRLDAEAPVSVEPALFEQGGYAVLRNSWCDDAHQMILDTGPLGCPVSGVHGHADLLSLQCSAFGEAYLVDAGNYCYAVDPRRRDYFRNSQAHSTVLIDKQSQHGSIGPFGWKYPRPAAQLNDWESNKLWQSLDAEHAGFATLSDPVLHRRRLIFVDSRFWIVLDDLIGSAEHQLEIRYQFAPIDVSKDSSGWIRARGKQGQALLLRAFSTIDLIPAIEEGQEDPFRAWVSPRYGQYVAAPAVTFSSQASLPLRIATVIYPVADPECSPPEVTSSIETGSLIGLRLSSQYDDLVEFDSHRVKVQSN